MSEEHRLQWALGDVNLRSGKARDLERAVNRRGVVLIDEGSANQLEQRAKEGRDVRATGETLERLLMAAVLAKGKNGELRISPKVIGQLNQTTQVFQGVDPHSGDLVIRIR